METTRMASPEISRPHDHSLTALHARLDHLAADVHGLLLRQRRTEELFEEMTPILKAMMASATVRLEDLEQKGYFAFGREVVGVGERIVEGFSPDDVRQLGGAVVGILETVRELTQPEVLKVVAEAAEVIQHAEQAEPIGLVGMVRATGDHEVQKGMSVMVEVMRQLGRAATVVREKRAASPMGQKKARLDAITGRSPRAGARPSARAGGSRALGTERTPRPIPLSVQKSRPPSAGPACAVPSAGPAAVASVLDGVGFGADGHLADPSTWTRALGEKLAALQGIAMTDAHWKLVEVARADFEATRTSPNIRRLTQIGGVTTKEIYSLFPKAPGRALAKIAGLPKPAGCL